MVTNYIRKAVIRVKIEVLSAARMPSRYSLSTALSFTLRAEAVIWLNFKISCTVIDKN